MPFYLDAQATPFAVSGVPFLYWAGTRNLMLYYQPAKHGWIPGYAVSFSANTNKHREGGQNHG